MAQSCLSPQLTGVQETMLWALHERVCATQHPGSAFSDPYSLQIYQSIDYDFVGHFGSAYNTWAAARALKFDQALKSWLLRHPKGFVVSLGEGLETQAYRVDNSEMRWLSVDLPDAIEWRERFIKPTRRFKHAALSALDLRWMEYVDDRSGIFVVAQGLLMYLMPDEVRQLLVAIGSRFVGNGMMFDVVARSLSEATKHDHAVTRSWSSPIMQWGLDRDEVVPTLRSWLPAAKEITCTAYRPASGRPAALEAILDNVLTRRQKLPSIACIKF